MLKQPDWHEDYFDLVNKVECECVQQGDLVPIWEQFKRMELTIQKLQGYQGAMEGEVKRVITIASDWMGDIEYAQFLHAIKQDTTHD